MVDRDLYIPETQRRIIYFSGGGFTKDGAHFQSVYQVGDARSRLVTELSAEERRLARMQEGCRRDSMRQRARAGHRGSSRSPPRRHGRRG